MEKRPVGLLLHQRQHRPQGGPDVAVDPQLQRGAPTQPRGVVVDLDRARLGQEAVVGEVGTQQNQQIGLVGGLVAGAVTEQPAHPDVVGIVELDPFLAAQRMPDRAVQLGGHLHHLGVGAGDSCSAEQGHRPCAVQPLGELPHLPIPRRHSPSADPWRARLRRVGRRAVQHVTGQHQHPHPTPAQGGLNRDPRQPRHLGGLADQLAEVAALDEQPLRVGLLEEAGADLFGGDVRGQRQHGSAGALRVVQALKQMRVPRSAATGAHRQLSGQRGVRRGCKRGGLFVTDMLPTDFT